MTNPPAANSVAGTKRPWMLLVSAVVLISADRWMKAVALAAGEGGLASRIFGLPVDMGLFLNPGIAFSLPLPNWIFWSLATLVMSGLAYTLVRTWHRSPALSVAIVFIVFGGLSNAIDRALVGSVIDYLIFFDRSAVNLADGMILGGSIAAYLISRRTLRNELPK